MCTIYSILNVIPLEHNKPLKHKLIRNELKKSISATFHLTFTGSILTI